MTDLIKGPWTVTGETTWSLDTGGGNSYYHIYNNSGTPVAIVAVDYSFNADTSLFEGEETLDEITSLVVSAPNMLKALKLQQEAFEALFAHCLSNGVFNAWGKPLDCTLLNSAKSAVDAVIYEAENAL